MAGMPSRGGPPFFMSLTGIRALSIRNPFFDSALAADSIKDRKTVSHRCVKEKLGVFIVLCQAILALNLRTPGALGLLRMTVRSGLLLRASQRGDKS